LISVGGCPMEEHKSGEKIAVEASILGMAIGLSVLKRGKE